jgi:lysophospholipase L1-like esterase
MYKKVIWPLLLFISMALAIVFISGFIASVVVSKSEESAPIDQQLESSTNKPEEGESMSEASSDILILGDSIGFGIGDEENLGIGKRYLDLIDEKDGNKKTSTNISVPSYESNELVNLIKSAENKASISKANLIIISIGGNDLNRLDYEDRVSLTLAFEEALKNYKKNLELITKEIRALNPDAQLALIGLYDPYSKEDPEKTRFLLDWNYETSLIVDSDVKFAYVPTYDLFKYHLTDYLSPDEFHPNGSGYQMIAEELDRILN